MKVEIFCSSPNFRGIHQYCLFIYRLANSAFSVTIRQPDISASNKSTLFQYIFQSFWEFFPGKTSLRADLEIYSSPRLPVRRFFSQRKNKFSGAVIHDFIQCIDDWSLSSLLSLYRDHGLIELVKRILHTCHFNLSLSKFDFIINNSRYTSELLRDYNSDQFKRLSSRSLVLHPSPSFSAASVEDTLAKVPIAIDPSICCIHIVTGFSPSKQAATLEKSLEKLKSMSDERHMRFNINIFGYSSPFLQSLSSNDFYINAHAGFVDEHYIIKSSLLSHLFLSTSRVEGFGIPLLDSLLFGLQCICTPIDSFREISTTYSSYGSPVRFTTSTSGIIADEIVDLIFQAVCNLGVVNTRSRARRYIHYASQIQIDSQRHLSSFLLSMQKH